MEIIKKLYNSALNFLFPHHCPICRKINLDSTGLCQDCWSKTRVIKKPACDICHYPFHEEVHEGMVCAQCIKKRPLYKKAQSVFIYDNFISKMIFDFKYKDKIHHSKFFAQLLSDNCSEIINAIDIIVPVPLHTKRLRSRKYNQALLIARDLAKVAGKRCLDDLLLRAVNNRPQVGLIGKERLKNVKGAFIINEKYLQDEFSGQIHNKNILLIDDVMTTGATLNNCAKVLLKQPINDVYVLTIARTVV